MENVSLVFDQRLDTEFLQSIYEDDMEHAMMVFSQFLHMAPALMGEIEESFQSGAVESFRQKVHKIKPVFSFVGLTNLTQKAEVLEKKCKEVSKIHEVSDLYHELKKQYSQGFPIIEKEAKRFEKPVN
jgi:HPt (histidine-containing phosphotransfer) domain-containing protein